MMWPSYNCRGCVVLSVESYGLAVFIYRCVIARVLEILPAYFKNLSLISVVLNKYLS